MAIITRLSRLVSGVQRHVDLSASGNQLHVDSLLVGSTSPVELTKAILTNLIALQNGSDFSTGTNAHTHDGRYYTESELDAGQLDNRYYTETEIGSTSNAQGASLVGIEDASAYYTGTDVEAALNELEAQLGGATSSTYAFAEDNVLADNDSVYAALNKLDLKWGDLASTASSEGASLVGIEDSAGLYAGGNVEAALAEVGQDAADLRTLSGTADGATNLGTFTGSTIADSSSIKSALQSLETKAEANEALINGLEWQDSAKDYIVDNTVAPPTEVSGDRYVLSHDGGSPNAAWDGASAGDIVEFDGSVWVAVTPTTGMFISVDDESTLLYYWGGAAWTTKAFESTTASGLLEKNTFDITFAASTVANIIVYDGSGEAASVAMSGEATIANTGAVTLDNGAVIGKVLTGYSSGAGTVAATDSILAAIQKIDGNQSAHEGAVSGAHDASAISYTPSTLSDWNSSADPGETDDALDQLASRLKVVEDEGASAESMTESFDAGETLTSGVRALRFRKAADAGGTDGRVHLADKDASGADNFYVIGLVVATGETAGTSVSVTKAGQLVATSHGLTVGEPFYLDASGGVSSTPSSTADDAVVKLGMVKDANTLEVQIQVMGIN